MMIQRKIIEKKLKFQNKLKRKYLYTSHFPLMIQVIKGPMIYNDKDKKK